MPEFWESLFQEMTSKLMLKLKDVEKKEKEFGRRESFLAAGTQYVSSSTGLGWKALGGK